MAKWTLDLAKYAKAKGEQIETIRKKVVFMLYNSITAKTPVRTGRARANWMISTGTPTEEIDDTTSPRHPTERTVPDASGDESYFIENNLPYIVGLEYGRSKQAPNGMVGLSVANISNMIDAAIQETENS